LKLKARLLGFATGGTGVVVLDDAVAKQLGVHPLDRVVIRYNGREVLAIVNVAKKLPLDEVALYDEVAEALGVPEGALVDVEPVQPPKSIVYIRNKLRGARLGYKEIYEIVRDIVRGALNEVEIAALVVTLHHQKLSMEEAYYFTLAMVETGERLELNRRPILDKHSLGGIPGDKTTILVVPIIASLGYTIPKTSSRAITSPAGTADRFEVLAPVDLTVDEMKEVVLKTGGCIVWGGALRLAPADDLIIRVEYPLAIDPFFIPSIMAKKAAVGSTHVVLDIPVGRGAKVGSVAQGERLAKDFMELGKRLGMHVEVALTLGDQPLGYAVGPALEAREALQALRTGRPIDLVNKAVKLAGILLGMVGVERPFAVAREALRSGKAERKLREIIEAQGGDPKVMPEDIPVGTEVARITSPKRGRVLYINNRAIAQIARTAGAPRDKGAGILLKVKMGEAVKEGDVLMEIYAEKGYKLDLAVRLAEELNPIVVGEYHEMMLLKHIPALPTPALLELER